MMMIVGCVLGFALLAAVYCLPLNTVRDAQKTADIFRSEGNRPSTIPTYTGTTGDNYTDALMIAEALYSDPQVSPLKQAVYIYRRANSDSASVDLADMLEGKDMQWEISYTRYWHGFLVVLRPMLMLFSYADLRMLMCAAQMLLFAWVLVTLARQNRMELIVPFLAVILTLSPSGTMLSLQYFAVYAIMMGGVLVILHGDAWLSQGARYGYFFLLMGMLTCYLDFLTYPLVTLFIPLLLALYLHAQDRTAMCFAVTACVMWCVGYLGFWVMKWTVGSLLVQENLVYNAYTHASYQMSMADVTTGSRMEAIKKNLAVLCRPGYAVVYAACLAACMLPLLRRHSDLKALGAGCRPIMPVIGFVPLAWWTLAASHSVVHTLFTYRLSAITVFAVLVWLTSAVQTGKKA
ncbi:MAG: hypothetical protein ACI4MM_12620 [Candidatus Ventricola sp.]